MLEEIAKGIWGAQHDLYMSGGVHFRGRMTVVQLESGALWLHSPIPIGDELACELAALGEVRYVVAPNKFHHLHIPKAKARYPEAVLYGAPGLAEKREDIAFDRVLSADSSSDWGSELQVLPIHGVPKLNEQAFFHVPTGSLIVTDLVFHILDVANWQTSLTMRLVGAYKRFAQSRAMRWMTKDRNAAHESIKQLMQWDIQRVIMAHGEIVEDDAKAQLRAALHWMLREKAA